MGRARLLLLVVLVGMLVRVLVGHVGYGMQVVHRGESGICHGRHR